MDQPEQNAHSFIIRIWLEETAQESGRVTWRGHITHVPDGERRYFGDLRGIIAFIEPYLKRMGVRLGIRWRVLEWLDRWSLPLFRHG